MTLTNPIISDLIVDGYRRDRLAATATDRLLAHADRSARSNRDALSLIERGLDRVHVIVLGFTQRWDRFLTSVQKRTLATPLPAAPAPG